MTHLKAALVLTWNSDGVRVLCPFNCDAKIHRHGCTMPEPGVTNSRLAHCVIDSVDGSYQKHPDYRLLFPFEDDPLTNGFWWEIDHEKSHWRTVSWGLDDHQYSEQDLETCRLSNVQSEISENENDDLEDAFGALHIQVPEPKQEKLEFDSYCVTNDLEDVQEMLDRSEDPCALINEVCYPGDKPILLATCEEGHNEMVDLLLKYNPHLELEDENGETALTRAIQYGYGCIAIALIEAGANMYVVDSNGQSLLKTARQSLNRQGKFRVYELRSGSRNNPATKIRLHRRELEISALRNIINQLELLEAKKCAERERKRLIKLHGEDQAEHFIETHTFDQTKIVADLLRKVFQTPTSGVQKTVACLTRGTALPYTFAVSGYTKGPLANYDGALDRPTWTKRVFQVAELLDHHLPESSYDAAGQPGSFYACHAEKQVLAFMLWMHSTVLNNPQDKAQLERCEPLSLANLATDIVIWQAKKTASVCFDCAKFCAKAAKKFDINLGLYVAHGSGVQLIQSWNRK